jgi:hypothetical protein
MFEKLDAEASLFQSFLLMALRSFVESIGRLGFIGNGLRG